MKDAARGLVRMARELAGAPMDSFDFGKTQGKNLTRKAFNMWGEYPNLVIASEVAAKSKVPELRRWSRTLKSKLGMFEAGYERLEDWNREMLDKLLLNSLLR